MNVYILLYNGFVEFEISVFLAILKIRNKDSSLHTFSVDDKVVTSWSGLHVEADSLLQDVEPSKVDFLVIPGGEPKVYKDRQDIQNFLRALHSRDIPIAAICGGPEFLAQAGLLTGKRIAHGHDQEYAAQVFQESTITDEDVIVDGNITTARGQAYVEFAIEIGRQLGLFESEDDSKETEQWFKNNI
ncbi:MAG: DJ-1/PfpI family protein [Candidatus Thorarchaeota archaeon]|jgi:putative intracellular protease/amidase